jgi:hypothetical protein
MTTESRGNGRIVATLVLLVSLMPLFSSAPTRAQNQTGEQRPGRPPYFGVFISVENRLIELRPTQALQSREIPVVGAPGIQFLESQSGINVSGSNVHFVLYDRSARNALPDIKLWGAAFAVMYAIPWEEKGMALSGRDTFALPLGRWVPTRTVDFRISPVADDPDMVRIVPYTSLADGVYILRVGEKTFDFTVNWDPALARTHRHNLLLRTNGQSALIPYTPPPPPEALAEFWVQHFDPSVWQFCVGKLYVQKDRVRFSASAAVHPEAHGFEVSCAEITEAKKNRAYGKQQGAFHIKTRRDNYNFAPSGSEFEAIIRPQSGFIVISPALPQGDPSPILDAVTKCIDRASGASTNK